MNCAEETLSGKPSRSRPGNPHSQKIKNKILCRQKILPRRDDFPGPVLVARTVSIGCDVQEGCRCRHARDRRRRTRVWQRGLRQGARAADAAVLQVQGRCLLRQGVLPGGGPPLRTVRRTRLLAHPHPLLSPLPALGVRV